MERTSVTQTSRLARLISQREIQPNKSLNSRVDIQPTLGAIRIVNHPESEQIHLDAIRQRDLTHVAPLIDSVNERFWGCVSPFDNPVERPGE